jgi:hypothetical protein
MSATDGGLAHVFHSVQKCYVIFKVVFTVTLHNNLMAFVEVLGSPLVEFLDHGRAESRNFFLGMRLQFSADFRHFHGIFIIFAYRVTSENVQEPKCSPCTRAFLHHAWRAI